MEEKVMKRLSKICGPENVSDDPIELMMYTRDSSPMFEEIPGVVVRPGNTQEVSAVLKVANEHKIRVMPRCAASTTCGNSVPRIKGMMVIQMDRMNRVLDIDEGAMVATVEAGCPWSVLDRTIKPMGWRIGIMPHGGGMLSGVGASVSVNGGALWSPKFGTQVQNVTGLEVVLPTGEIIRTGTWAWEGNKPLTSYAGNPGLVTNLFASAEGMLGVITQVAIRIYAVPKARKYFLYTFKTISDIQKALYKIQKNDLAAALFMMSREIVATTGWPVPIEPSIWGGLEGCSQGEVEEKVKVLHRIVEDVGGTEADPKIAQAMGEELDENNIMHRYTWANEAYNPGGGRFQVLVAGPFNRLDDFHNITYAVAAKHKMDAFSACHGISKNWAHMFTVMPYKESEPGQREKALAAGAEALQAVIDAGFGITTGAGLQGLYYDRMHKGTFEFIKSIKGLVDPNNIMQAPWE